MEFIDISFIFYLNGSAVGIEAKISYRATSSLEILV